MRYALLTTCLIAAGCSAEYGTAPQGVSQERVTQAGFSQVNPFHVVEVTYSGRGAYPQPNQVPDVAAPGDSFRAPADGAIAVRFADDTRVVLEQLASAGVIGYDDAGRPFLSIGSGSQIVECNEQCLLRIAGAIELEMRSRAALDVTPEKTTIYLLDGEIDIRTPRPVRFRAGQYAVIEGDSVVIRDMTPAMRREIVDRIAAYDATLRPVDFAAFRSAAPSNFGSSLTPSATFATALGLVGLGVLAVEQGSSSATSTN